MKFTTVIDISTFIWCEKDYNDNPSEYFRLIDVIPILFEVLQESKLPILFRQELYDIISVEFPYKMAKEINRDFQKLTFSFLSATISNWVVYYNNTENSVSPIPLLAKQHLSENGKKESQSQINHIFVCDRKPEHKFVAYSSFYNHNTNLILKCQDKELEIDTLCYSTKTEVIEFFEKYKLKFDHNPKHKKNIYYNTKGDIVSPFSCYFEPNGEFKAQKLLEESFFHEEHYYNFDIDNNVYIRFIKTIDSTYHGHDLSDEEKYVPHAVKKKFNKDGRKF